MTIPTDTLFSQQWHLHNATIGQFDLNVVDVWDDYTGKGIKVLVIDDGFEHTHSDLIPNYDTSLDRDYGAGDEDAAPLFNDGRDNHGTAVMGIIGAASNGTGVVGVAHDSTLIGARITYAVTNNAWTTNFVNALTDGMNNGADVVNMSFGGASDFDTYTGAENLSREKAAINMVLADGRDGLGMILVKSAGNSRVNDIDVNHNQTDNHSGSIIVAAVNRDGFVSNYSSYGSAILVAGFGSPGGGNGEILTTDRLGSSGYDPSDFTAKFNGTSAAAPMVSGVASLVLDANGGLGWRDVQTILASTARHVGSTVDGSSLAGFEENPWDWNGGTKWNGGGMHFSRDYGYGLVDTFAAVRLAESWIAKSTSGNETSAALDLLNAAALIPDGDLNGTTFNGNLKSNIEIERVTVTLGLNVGQTEDLDIYLVSPDGEKHLLVADQGDDFSDAYTGTFTYHSQAYRGETSAGLWSLQIIDDLAGNATNISDIKIRVFGSAASKNDTYIYTDEFSQFLDMHSTKLTDGDGGKDVLNAAAVSSAITVDLTAKTGMIDGQAITISGIDNVFGGRGDDTLTGNKGNNVLAGGRGGDDVLGGKGDDIFRFFVVQDSRGGGQDFFGDFGRGNDVFDLSDIDANINSARNDRFKFIGERDLTGVAGQLHFQRAGGVTFAGGDVNGDGVVDIIFSIDGAHKLVKGDFDL